MEGIINIVNWVTVNKVYLFNLLSGLCFVASVIVKLVPTLDEKNRLKAFIKFLGKYIALDKYGPKGA